MKRLFKIAFALLSALLLFAMTVTVFAEAAEEAGDDTVIAEAAEEAGDDTVIADGDAQAEGDNGDEKDNEYTINGISFTADPEVWEVFMDDEDFKTFIMKDEDGRGDIYLIAGEVYEDFSDDPDELFSHIAGDEDDIASNLFSYDPDVLRTDYYTLNGLKCMSFFINGDEGEYMELQAVRNTEGEILLMALIVFEDIDAREYMIPWRETALSICLEDEENTDNGYSINTEGLNEGGNFRNFYWGDDIAFVAEEEDAEANDAEILKNAIIGLPVSVAGFDAEASFGFDDGMLVSGKYTILSDHEYGDEYVKDHEALKAALTEIYGEPDKDFVKTVVQEKTSSYNESLGEELKAGLVELYAVWHAPETEIQLTTGYRDDVLAVRIGFYMAEDDY